MGTPASAEPHEDGWGGVSTEPPPAAWSDAVHALLGHRATLVGCIDAVRAASPEFVPARCVQGFGLLFKGRVELRGRALRLADEVAPLCRTPREQLLVAAIRAWANDDALGALRALREILERHPTDALTIKVHHGLAFLYGDRVAMLGALEGVATAWSDATPGSGYMHGCHAFALCEDGQFERSEAVGRRAVELEPSDAWGIHAVSHSFEMRDRPEVAAQWLDAHRAGYDGCSVFRGHVYWHRAMIDCELGRPRDALALYDAHVARPWVGDYRDMSNCTTLLWRLESDGIDVGDRWVGLAEIAATFGLDHGSAFADAHYALALRQAGDPAPMRASLAAHCAEDATGAQRAVQREVGAPLVEAIALGPSEPARSFEKLVRLQKHLVRMGGSNAQRDVFELIRLQAALDGGQRAPETLRRAQRALRQRLGERPGHQWAKQRVAPGSHHEAGILA